MNGTLRTKEIARELVAELAPDEIDLFDQLWSEAQRDPALLQAGGSKRDQHLGMGIDGETSLLSLVIIPMVISVIKAIAGDAGKQTYSYIKTWFGSSPQPAHGLTDDQIDQLAKSLSERLAGGSRKPN